MEPHKKERESRMNEIEMGRIETVQITDAHCFACADTAEGARDLRRLILQRKHPDLLLSCKHMNNKRNINSHNNE